MTDYEHSALNQLTVIETIQLFESMLYEMAAIQGSDSTFTYYTLDREYVNHHPHVHVCVPVGDKHWEGKPLRSGNPHKSVATVRLRKDNDYTTDNLQFDSIGDTKVLNNANKKLIVLWLTGHPINYKGESQSITNSEQCLDYYFRSNSDIMPNIKAEYLG